MKKIRKECLRRTRKFLEKKFRSRNLIKEINTWSVPFVRFFEKFSKWKKEKLKLINISTKKLITILKDLHVRDYIDRLYV